jgi:hypothetical protein
VRQGELSPILAHSEAGAPFAQRTEENTVKRPKSLRLVLVTLDDMEHMSGWAPIGEPWTTITYQTVGWLVSKTKRWVTLAHIANNHGANYCRSRIPAGAVRKIEDLA